MGANATVGFSACVAIDIICTMVSFSFHGMCASVVRKLGVRYDLCVEAELLAVLALVCPTYALAGQAPTSSLHVGGACTINQACTSKVLRMQLL